MVRTPMLLSAAMLARFLTSWGASSWCRPWRERKAMGMGLPVEGEGWCRMEIGDDGSPHGVSTLSVAARVKPGSDWMPVPPMTAMWTGAAGCQQECAWRNKRKRWGRGEVRTVVRRSDTSHPAVWNANGSFRGRCCEETRRYKASSAKQHTIPSIDCLALGVGNFCLGRRRTGSGALAELSGPWMTPCQSPPQPSSGYPSIIRSAQPVHCAARRLDNPDCRRKPPVDMQRGRRKVKSGCRTCK